MSTVFVHVGQCGNQIGHKFWAESTEVAESNPNVKHAFWTPGGPGRDSGGHMRSVFIDSEKKVLQKLTSRMKTGKKAIHKLKFGHGNLISSARGCGSNWSLGHNHMPREKVVNPWPLYTYSYSHELDYGNDDCVLKASMEAIRREVEACDCFSGFIMCHSLGGGTGSGIGARLCSELRDRYPVAYRMNVVVAPHRSGDSPMQSYNETLCLSTLQQNSDAIIMFENDDVLGLIPKTTGNSAAAKQVSYDDMNAYIASCISNLISPVSNLTPPNGVTVGIEPWELIRSAAPMSNLKLLRCRTVGEASASAPTPPASWDKLISRLCQQERHSILQTNSTDGAKPSTLAAVCVCRNVGDPGKPEEKVDIAKLASKVKSVTQCVDWNPFPVDVWVDHAGYSKPRVKLKHGQKSLTLCNNLSSLATGHCNDVLESAKLKFKAKAYLHWYERYGTSSSDFEDAFEVLQDIVNEYKMAVAPPHCW